MNRSRFKRDRLHFNKNCLAAVRNWNPAPKPPAAGAPLPATNRRRLPTYGQNPLILARLVAFPRQSAAATACLPGIQPEPASKVRAPRTSPPPTPKWGPGQSTPSLNRAGKRASGAAVGPKRPVAFTSSSLSIVHDLPESASPVSSLVVARKNSLVTAKNQLGICQNHVTPPQNPLAQLQNRPDFGPFGVDVAASYRISANLPTAEGNRNLEMAPLFALAAGAATDTAVSSLGNHRPDTG